MPRKRRAPGSHSYEIVYRGKIIRCRSLEDMKSALRELEGSILARQELPWSSDEFQKFTGRVHVPQKRLLARLLEAGPSAWVEDSDLRKVLDLPDNNSLSGSLSGISKVARMFDIGPRRVYSQNTVYRHGKAQRMYQITGEFQKAARRRGWPSKDDLRYQ